MEEYIIAKLIEICHVNYDFAQTIVIDLDSKDLLEDLFISLENGTIKKYRDLYELYY